jgi:ribonuclease VapC
LVVDTSAVMAVLFAEPDRSTFQAALLDAESSFMSTATVAECGAVLDRRSRAAGPDLDRLLSRIGVQIVALTPSHAAIARHAHRDFGRGSGHPAGLNFGDCFSYALAIDLDLPLLFTGDDFGHTDVRVALPRY